MGRNGLSAEGSVRKYYGGIRDILPSMVFPFAIDLAEILYVSSMNIGKANLL